MRRVHDRLPDRALTLNRRVAPVWDDVPEAERNEMIDPAQPLPAGKGFLTADEMLAVEIPYLDADGVRKTFAPFRGIPKSYLRWNEGAVRRRDLADGGVLRRGGVRLDRLPAPVREIPRHGHCAGPTGRTSRRPSGTSSSDARPGPRRSSRGRSRSRLIAP